MSTLGALSGIGRGLQNVAQMVFERQKEKRAEDRKKKREQEIMQAYKVFNQGGLGLPEGGEVMGLDNASVNKAALTGAEGVLLRENVIPYSALDDRMKEAEKAKVFNDTLSGLSPEFLADVKPILPLIQQDPDRLISIHTQWNQEKSKLDAKGKAANELTTLEKQKGFNPTDPQVLELAGQIVGKDNALSFMKNRYPTKFASEKTAPEFEQKWEKAQPLFQKYAKYDDIPAEDKAKLNNLGWTDAALRNLYNDPKKKPDEVAKLRKKMADTYVTNAVRVLQATAMGERRQVTAEDISAIQDQASKFMAGESRLLPHQKDVADKLKEDAWLNKWGAEEVKGWLKKNRPNGITDDEIDLIVESLTNE